MSDHLEKQEEHSHHQPLVDAQLYEPDELMPYKIRPLDLIKYNPNMFHVNLFDSKATFQILGSYHWLTCTGLGAYFGYCYSSRRLAVNHEPFYVRTMHRWGRLVFGAVVGAWIGYMKFGDRQRLHNAWVAERLRRRYPESLMLNQEELWMVKG